MAKRKSKCSVALQDRTARLYDVAYDRRFSRDLAPGDKFDAAIAESTAHLAKRLARKGECAEARNAALSAVKILREIARRGRR